MLAVPAAAPFSDDAWLFEPKWDGVRALAAWDGTALRLFGRRGDDVTARYPELQGLTVPVPAVLDGEIIALGADGLPSFEALQRRMHRDAPGDEVARTPVTFVAFDLLHSGEPLTALPLEERRGRLGALTLPAGYVVSESVRGEGEALWAAVADRDLEGIVAKRLASPYRQGERSPEWRKVANVAFAKAVVGGFTPGEGGRRGTFGALLLGQWDGPALRFVGAVGTGFSDFDLREIRRALDTAVSGTCPFHDDPAPGEGAAWVHPALVASVGYRNWTQAGRLRHPRFRGFTGDPVEAITWSEEGPG
ncbi:MAG: non-homologous end-joining DNA ligase [Actinobacteria bacterium]|nr:non-homologous end-joining DNA ligase [Actinomycetota bacterium]